MLEKDLSWISTSTVERYHLKIPNKGRTPALTACKEEIVAQAVLYYANNNTPLTTHGIKDVVQDFVSMLPSERQNKIGFLDNRPSKNYVSAFLTRNDLQVPHVQMMENKHVQAVREENLTENIFRIRVAIQRYHITVPRFTFYTDQSGASFEKMKDIPLRKGIGSIGARLVQRALTIKGSLDRVTVMSVVSVRS